MTAQILQHDAEIRSGELIFPKIGIKPELARLFASHVEQICSRISRTFQGESNTDSSLSKPKLIFEGQALSARVKENFSSVLRSLLIDPPCTFENSNSALEFFHSIGVALNSGLFHQGRILLRTWETGIPGHVSVNDIESELKVFAEQFSSHWKTLNLFPRAFATWVEREYNGRIHPDTDGCGRKSRLLAALILGLNQLPYPAFVDRNDAQFILTAPFEKALEHYSIRINEAKGQLRPPF